jgi:hypothetical protein
MGSRGVRSASASAGGGDASKIVNDNMKAFDKVDTDGVKQVKNKALTEAIKKYFHEERDGKGWDKVVEQVKFWEHPWFEATYFATYKDNVISYGWNMGASANVANPIHNALRYGRMQQNESKHQKEVYDNIIKPAVTQAGTGKENFNRPKINKG